MDANSLDLKSVYKDLISLFSKSNLPTPDLDARLIIEVRTSFDWSDLIAGFGKELTIQQYDEIQSDAQKRLSGVPLSRIYGVCEFWGLEFEITEDTLDPRPDTELILDLALQRFPKDAPLKILDLGTGSGCILIALLSEFKNAKGVGVDISGGAIQVAQKNAVRNGCADRAKFLCGSWFEPVSENGFDLIISNPPYISCDVIPSLMPEVKNHDPILALDGGNDGLNPYRIIFPLLKNYLTASGIGLFEIGYDQGESVMRLAEESGFALRSVHLDMASNPRVVEISCGDK